MHVVGVDTVTIYIYTVAMWLVSSTVTANHRQDAESVITSSTTNGDHH